MHFAVEPSLQVFIDTSLIRILHAIIFESAVLFSVWAEDNHSLILFVNRTDTRVHINGDISFALRKYTSVTRDRMWLQEAGGCETIHDIAKFWFSRSKKSRKNDRFDIKGKRFNKVLVSVLYRD